MSLKEIPARQEISCDKCFKGIPHTSRYQLQIKSCGGILPYSLPENRKIYQYDFCRDCFQKMHKLITDNLIPF